VLITPTASTTTRITHCVSPIDTLCS